MTNDPTKAVVGHVHKNFGSGGGMPTSVYYTTATASHTATEDCLAFIIVEWDDSGAQNASYTIEDTEWGTRTVNFTKQDHKSGGMALTTFTVFLHKGSSFTFSCDKFVRGPYMYITEFIY